MILKKNRYLSLLIGPILALLCFANPVSGQNKLLPVLSLIKEAGIARQDTALEFRKRNALMSEPDTNFTWEKYAAFLTKISDTSKYIVLPISEFRKVHNTNKIIIGLRHDLDTDLNLGYLFSEIEWEKGFRASYYILHTAPYYLANPNNMAIHSEGIIPVLKKMQDDRHFEIGWHNDLVTLQVIYNINSITFLTNELNWLRSNGINITGTAAHGSNYCKVYHYLNYYFFNEFSFPAPAGRENNITVPIGGTNIPIMKGKLSDFGFDYEAYFIDFNKYFSDATITNGIRWDIGMLDLNQLKNGDRVQLLLHPMHWHKASVSAAIESFRISGQLSASIDASKSTISVVMPYGTNKNSLLSTYNLSPGAFAKVSGKLQVSGSSLNNFSNSLVYSVYAENRDIRRDWTVNVKIAKNSAANFESFVIPDFTKSVVINTIKKNVLLTLKDGADPTHLPVQFTLSAGARAFINDVEQFSNAGTIDFSDEVQYRIAAEDGISSSTWTVNIRPQYNANFISFSVPGMIGKAKIDTLNKTVVAEINSGESINSLAAIFELSTNARAWIGKQEQLSNITVNNFTDPISYNIVSKDSLLIKKWKVTVLQSILSSKGSESIISGLSIYPNPSDGKVYMHFRDIKTFPVKVEIFNTLGTKVYSELIGKTGTFEVEANLSGLPAGVYIVKYSLSEKPAIIIIR
jgi:hypothetical protein